MNAVCHRSQVQDSPVRTLGCGAIMKSVSTQMGDDERGQVTVRNWWRWALRGLAVVALVVAVIPLTVPPIVRSEVRVRWSSGTA
jgi:hypothetical protein